MLVQKSINFSIFMAYMITAQVYGKNYMFKRFVQASIYWY